MPSAALKQAQKEQEQRIVFGPDDTSDVESPAYECQSYRAQIDDVVMMREVAGGTKTMRAAGEKYLPKHPMETDTKYAVRQKIAIAFNALGKTVSGLVGMIFRRAMVISEDMDAAIKAAAEEDIDQKGHELSIFMHYGALDALKDGHVWIHVESPPEGTAATRAEERRLGVRPYWIKVLKSQAINWRYVIRDGKPILTLFAYHEGGSEPAGSFGEKLLKRIRVLREVEGGVRGELWEWEEGDGKDKKPKWRRIDEYPVAASRVPVVFLPSCVDEGGGPFESEPPLRDLAYEQAEHYRVRSDRQKSMTFSSIAVPYAFGKGFLDEDGNASVAWGPDGMLLSNDPEATAGVIESQGHGLEATKAELSHIEGRMAALGLQMLVRNGSPQPGSAEVTATADIMKRAEGDASIVLFADAIEAAANEALELHASYSSTKPTPGYVTVNRDFHAQLLSPQHIQQLREMVATGDLSQETLWDRLVEGEILPEDFDPEAEQARIAKQTEARLKEQESMLAAAQGNVREEEDELAGAGALE